MVASQNGPSQNGPMPKRHQIGQNGPTLDKTAPSIGQNGPKSKRPQIGQTDPLPKRPQIGQNGMNGLWHQLVINL